MDFYSEDRNIFNHRQQEDIVLSPQQRSVLIKNVVGVILKGQIRIVYYLFEYHNLSLKEIAQTMGLSYQTVKTYKKEANKRIKQAAGGV